ncbi:twitch domain-containing radical SAM protein [bacterium]|nr:twitch domain-containing radical SAM protein [bacterium]
MRKRLDAISPSFCMAKWLQSSIHLMTGHTRSCCLPKPHKIDLEELKTNPSALHNTEINKQSRKQMKCGERPKECQTCWSFEDLPGNHYSDRHYRGVEDWTLPFYEKVEKLNWKENINPTYMEVSFSSTCNFKCMYCSPSLSSSWMKEIKSYGPIKLSPPSFHQDLRFIGQESFEEDQNPYLDAFWEWWPSLSKELMYFRISGGEPLLSETTFKVLEWLKENPRKQLQMSINSNMGVSEKRISRFIELLKSLYTEKKIKSYLLHTSLDTWGPQSEYIRTGLNLKDFNRNLDRYLEEMPESSLAFMCTFNCLSLINFEEFLEYIMSLRKRLTSNYREIFLDIAHLERPEMFSAQILTKDFDDKMTRLIAFMKNHENERSGIKRAEIQKMERIQHWMRQEKPKDWLDKKRADFYLYLKAHDERRGVDFLETFPQMRDFWELCKKTHESLVRR